MKKIIILTLTVTFMISGMALAQPYKKNNTSVPMFRWWKVTSVKEQLNITDAESKEFDKVYQEAKTKMIDFKAAAEKKMMVLEMELSQESLNKDQCLKIFKETQDLRSSMAMEKFKFVLKTKEILKQERFEQLTEIYKKQRKQKGAKKSLRSKNKQGKGCPQLGQNQSFQRNGEGCPQFGQNQPCQLNGQGNGGGCQKKFN